MLSLLALRRGLAGSLHAAAQRKLQRVCNRVGSGGMGGS